MQRTEEEILTRAPLKIKLGKDEHDVKILALGPARKWRQRLLQEMSLVLASFRESPTPENMSPALTAAMISFPDKLLDLVKAYAPDLPASVEEEATDEQLAVAYGKITAVAFPFLAQLSLTQQVLKSQR